MYVTCSKREGRVIEGPAYLPCKIFEVTRPLQGYMVFPQVMSFKDTNSF